MTVDRSTALGFSPPSETSGPHRPVPEGGLDNVTADNTHDREGAPSPATPEDRRATTVDLSPMANRPIATDSRDLARPRQRFDGQVLLPDEPGHHQARQVWNAMVDRSRR